MVITFIEAFSHVTMMTNGTALVESEPVWEAGKLPCNDEELISIEMTCFPFSVVLVWLGEGVDSEAHLSASNQG